MLAFRLLAPTHGGIFQARKLANMVVVCRVDYERFVKHFRCFLQRIGFKAPVLSFNNYLHFLHVLPQIEYASYRQRHSHIRNTVELFWKVLSTLVLLQAICHLQSSTFQTEPAELVLRYCHSFRGNCHRENSREKAWVGTQKYCNDQMVAGDELV